MGGLDLLFLFGYHDVMIHDSMMMLSVCLSLSVSHSFLQCNSMSEATDSKCGSFSSVTQVSVSAKSMIKHLKQWSLHPDVEFDQGPLRSHFRKQARRPRCVRGHVLANCNLQYQVHDLTNLTNQLYL